MTAPTTALIARPDTFFGICEAVGRDLGFPPNLLRVALGVSILWQPLWVLAAYAGLGVAVFASRLLFPVPTAPASPLPVASASVAQDETPLVLAEAA